MRFPGRAVSYSHVHPAPPPVRTVYAHPGVIALQPQRPAIDTTPSLSTFTPTAAPSNATLTGSGGTPIPLGQLLNPVPGLGFDFTHLAAVNSGLAVRAFIDPVTQHELAIAQQLPREQPVGFFPAYDYGYGYGGEVPAAPSTPRPEIVVLQQPAAQPAPAVAAPAPVAAAPAPPPLPVGELYLVRRDGKTIKVIAFSQQGGQIVYITANGMRHTMSLNDLNVKATEKRNAERGTILHLTE